MQTYDWVTKLFPAALLKTHGGGSPSFFLMVSAHFFFFTGYGMSFVLELVFIRFTPSVSVFYHYGANYHILSDRLTSVQLRKPGTVCLGFLLQDLKSSPWLTAFLSPLGIFCLFTELPSLQLGLSFWQRMESSSFESFWVTLQLNRENLLPEELTPMTPSRSHGIMWHQKDLSIFTSSQN